MQLTSWALERVADGMDAALDDVVTDAQRRARKVTGTWSQSIRRTDVEERGNVLTSHVGSDLASATAHEKGAYIQARRSDWLYIPQPDGTFRKVKAVRLKAQPAIIPAVKTFGRRFSASMRTTGLRSRKGRIR